ncbi:MAG: TfuA-like protein [Actinomycetota bacterium]
MTVVVFLGPTLARADAERILDAVYLPPARQADVLSAVTTYRPAAIGLIDGLFGQTLSVWHKEILFALERGVAVYGASSMGALRAVETERYGMVGVGEVFRMYHSGELTDDDEVALAHGDKEGGFRPLSEPLVNVRKTLARARAEGVVSPGEHDELVRIAKGLYFPERTVERIVILARESGLGAERSAEVKHFFETSYVDIKRDDAVELLSRLARREWEGAPPPGPFRTTRSHLFDAMFNRDRTVRHGDVDVPLESIAAHAALHLPEFPALASAALNRTLVGILAELLEVEADEEEIQATRGRMERQFGVEEGNLDAWAERQRLEPEELDEMVREQAVVRKLQLWLVTRRFLERTTKMMLDELRLAGRFDEVLAGGALTERVIREHYPTIEQFDHSDVELQTLLGEHMRATQCRIDGDLADWIEIAGFRDVHELRFELLRERLVRDVLRKAAADLSAALSRADGD